jgi:hypothetical protein
MDAHREIGEPYKTIHYAHFGSLVNFVLGVYDKVVVRPTQTTVRVNQTRHRNIKPNQTKIPLSDLEDMLVLALTRSGHSL